MTDDQGLVSRIVSGDLQAFKLLIRRHERLVAHMIGRLVQDAQDREEISQDVFMKVYEKIGDFGFQSKLSTWIATIAYRHAINHLRKGKLPVSEVTGQEDHSDFFVDTNTPEELLSDQDQEAYVLKLIEMLPSQYKIVLTLYHLENMNYQEIGSVTGMPEGTVKNYLFRARQMLKEKVKLHYSKEELI